MSEEFKILRNIEVPTGNILIVSGDKGRPLECLSIGDYGKDVNLKCDSMGLTRKLTQVNHTNMLPLKEKWVITISTQYGCNSNCNFCLLGNTPILMEDFTYKNINLIKLGDRVVSNLLSNESGPLSDYVSLRTSSSSVTGIINRQYSGDMYTITTKSGKSITCTSEHPIAATYKSRKKFIPANMLHVGDTIYTCRHPNIEQRENSDWKLGWCLGFLEGDGTYDTNKTNYSRWGVSQKHLNLISIHKEWLSSFNLKSSNIYKMKDKGGKVNGYRYWIGGKNAAWINEQLLITNRSTVFINGYIAGFWDAEGFSLKHNSCVRVCNTNPHLLSKLENWFLEMGYVGKYYNRVKEKKYHKQCQTLSISMSKDDFVAKFTPLHDKKNFLGYNPSSIFCNLDKISEIKVEKYSGIVYNIETEHHTYYAQDVLTHNCDVPKVGRGVNATLEDMLRQVECGLSLHPEVTFGDRLNIHYARMGEPTFNPEVLKASYKLRELLNHRFKVIHPVVSTMMPKRNKNLLGFLLEWMHIKNYTYKGEAGLQLSINSTSEIERRKMFSNNALDLEEISKLVYTFKPVGRKITLNFAVADYTINANYLAELFNPKYFICKLTPMHKTKEALSNNIKTTGDYTSFYPYEQIEENLKKAGFDVLVFIASKEEDEGRITCGNAILSGTEPFII